MVKSKAVKKQTKLQSVEIKVSLLARIARVLHDELHIGWGQVADMMGISENTLRTIRKNAKK